MSKLRKKIYTFPTLGFKQRGEFLHFCVKFNGKESNYRSANIRIEPPEKWNNKTRTIEGNEYKTLAVNELCTNLSEVHFKVKSLGQPTSAKLLIDYMTNERSYKSDVPNVIGTIQHYIDSRKIEVENGHLTKITFNRYNVRKQNTILFFEQKYGTSNLTLAELKPSIGEEYASFLRNHKKLGVSTVNKDLGFFKAILTHALSNEWTNRNVLSQWKRTKEITDIKYLNYSEVRNIETLHIIDETLDKVRWIFVFCCYTGFSYTDLMLLKPEHVVKDENDNLYIKKPRQKSKVIAIVPLVKSSLEILARYHAQSLKTGLLLPQMSLKEFNQQLKALQSLAGFSRFKLTSKIGRNSFATIMLNAGVPAEVLINATGHTNTSVLNKHYASVYQSTTIDAISEAFNKLSNNLNIK